MKRTNLFKPPAEQPPEELVKMIETDMRCLSLCIAMLERVMSVSVQLVTAAVLIRRQSFDENSTLDGILSELIIPAVKSKDPSLRERGMVALGLCCLIHRVLSGFLESFNFLWLEFVNLTQCTEIGYRFIQSLHQPSRES